MQLNIVCFISMDVSKTFLWKYRPFCLVNVKSLPDQKPSCLAAFHDLWYWDMCFIFTAEGDLKQFTTITTHHQARHGYNASLFLTTNRPQCVHDLYSLCATNPTKVIRAADLYRKDGLSGSKMFKCWPVIMNEHTIRTPDLSLPRRVCNYVTMYHLCLFQWVI